MGGGSRGVSGLRWWAYASVLLQGEGFSRAECWVFGWFIWGEYMLVRFEGMRWSYGYPRLTTAVYMLFDACGPDVWMGACKVIRYGCRMADGPG